MSHFLPTPSGPNLPSYSEGVPRAGGSPCTTSSFVGGAGGPAGRARGSSVLSTARSSEPGRPRAVREGGRCPLTSLHSRLSSAAPCGPSSVPPPGTAVRRGDPPSLSPSSTVPSASMAAPHSRLLATCGFSSQTRTAAQKPPGSAAPPSRTAAVPTGPMASCWRGEGGGTGRVLLPSVPEAGTATVNRAALHHLLPRKGCKPD